MKLFFYNWEIHFLNLIFIFRSKRVTNEPLPSTQVSSRNDIFQQEEVDQDLVKEEADRMDTLMRQLMGGDEEDDEEEQGKPLGKKNYSIRRGSKKFSYLIFFP